MANIIKRREFIRRAAGAGVGAGLFGAGSVASATRVLSANDKLNIGMIGTANRAMADLEEVKGENIVALCDVDDTFLARAGEMFPAAKRYNDFRKMLEQKDIDAVVIGTPDHIHAPATLAALELGKPVYCEKPLTHNVREARLVAEAARKAKVATQLGTQIHAGDNYRRAVEAIQSGAIGPVTEVHVWVGKTWAGSGKPAASAPVPPNLHWDLWLGPAPERPFHPDTYHTQNWRRWWDFGGGTLADMGCHYIDLPFWALGLKNPIEVAAWGPEPDPDTAPHDLKIEWKFPARGDAPPVTLTWYDDNLRPEILKEISFRKKGKKVEYDAQGNAREIEVMNPAAPWDSGVLFIGAKGMMLANYDEFRLLPEEKFAGWTPPPQTIPQSIGHHQEWILACKTGSPTTCNFEYSGALTESVLLGNVAFRLKQPFTWDAANLKANVADAERFVRRQYRKGWEI